jgi:hypothetical protein
MKQKECENQRKKKNDITMLEEIRTTKKIQGKTKSKK